MHEVAACTTPGWIVVRPMHHTAFIVPFVYPAKRNLIAFTQAVDSGSDVYVVGDEHRMAGSHTHNEPLVTRALVVVRKNPRYPACFRNGKVASAAAKGIFNDTSRTWGRRLYGVLNRPWCVGNGWRHTLLLRAHWCSRRGRPISILQKGQHQYHNQKNTT